jgi:site-specific recombinase XerD
VNRDLSIFRSVLTTAWENEMMPDEAYNRAHHVKGVPKDTMKAGRALDVGELRTLVQAGKAWALEPEPEGALGRRALAVLALMYGAGLRRTEVAGVLTANVDLEGSKIALVGKRNKRRIAYLAPGWETFVQEWAGSADPSPRLIGVRSPESVGRIIEALQGRAKIAPFTPHDLRRSFGTHLLEMGRDVLMTRDLLGHDDVRTTMLYDRRDEEKLREAVAGLPGPEDEEGEV